jgi:DNA-binding IclR family transcriptional regulator
MSTGTERIRLGSPGGTESADRVADVLLLFAQTDRPLGVSEIARTLVLSKAVVHRILQSLTTRSLTWAVPGESTYILGPAATTLSMKAWSQLDLRSLAAPILRKLRDDTRETTTLSVLVGHQRMYLDQYESPQEVKMVVDLGPRFPLHSGASSRAILAHLPQPVIDNAVAQLQEIRPNLDVADYQKGLADIREVGYAVSLNERGTGAASIAAPFFDTAGNVLGSISSSGPVFRYGEEGHEDHVRLVIDAAHAITTELAQQRR